MYTRNQIIAMVEGVDALLDTIVFGRPLGLFGEKLAPAESNETHEEVKPTTQNCNGQPRDKNGRFCKVEVKVENPTKVEVKVAQPKPEESKYSIIGKRMKVEDDEYTYTKSGAFGHIEGQVVTILSDPYINEDIDSDHEVVNVISEETGREYVCEFRETWLIK